MHVTLLAVISFSLSNFRYFLGRSPIAAPWLIVKGRYPFMYRESTEMVVSGKKMLSPKFKIFYGHLTAAMPERADSM